MMLRKILKYGAVPGLLLASGIAIFVTIDRQLNYELAAMGVFFFTSIFILLLEHLNPLKPDWKTKRAETATDIKHLLSTAVFDALGKTFALWLMLYIHRWYAPYNLWEGIPFILAFVFANIVGEFLPYAYHRISHIGKSNSVISLFLWKIHSIHHLPVSLNWFKANWMHPINMFLNTLFKYGTLLLLGFNEEIIFAVGITHVVIAYLSHANIETKTGVLDLMVVTPKIHQFHHSEKLHEAKNFGNIIPFWDLIFGTYYNRKGVVENVGVAKAGYDYPPHKAFMKQVAFPLYARKNCCLPNERG